MFYLVLYINETLPAAASSREILEEIKMNVQKKKPKWSWTYCKTNIVKVRLNKNSNPSNGVTKINHNGRIQRDKTKK